MNIKIWKDLSAEEKTRLLLRSGTDIGEAAEIVRPIIEDVRTRGDAALREYTLKFDGADLSGLSLKASDADFAAAEQSLTREVKSALIYAIENVLKFHEHQKPGPMTFSEIRPGVFAGEKASPLPSAGIYVPRGRGSFPSMLYMVAVPAVVAGISEIRVVTPPNPDGSLDAACLFAAKFLGLSEVYRVGGAQAIAALSYGTESIPRVCKIVGPGSRYVAAAKQLLSGLVDTGLPAGPSESIVLADGSADPRLVVLDLLIEAEHGSDSSALLVTHDRPLADAVAALLPEIIAGLPEPRRTYAADVFSGYGGILVTDTFEEAAEVVNDFAPEHLQIQTRDPFGTLSLIRNAGEILLGPSTPFSLANYAAGANAVLPTGGKAKSYSAVSVRDFIKYSSVVRVGPEGFGPMRDHVVALAEYEGFPAHAEALKKRNTEGGLSLEK